MQMPMPVSIEHLRDSRTAVTERNDKYTLCVKVIYKCCPGFPGQNQGQLDREKLEEGGNKMKKRTLVSMIAVALVLCVSIGGVLAYLTAKTDTVTNTFTVGDIDITLTETYNTDTNSDNVNDAWTAKLIPGTTYDKDPVVTVKKGSEKCYLFVKFDETNSPGTYLDYTALLTENDGWTHLTSKKDKDGNVTYTMPDGVYVRIVDASASTSDISFNLLKDNKVTVKTSVTKAMINALTDATMPELSFTAYAVQKENIADAYAAWEALK